jgi:hypothetical protein
LRPGTSRPSFNRSDGITEVLAPERDRLGRLQGEQALLPGLGDVRVVLVGHPVGAVQHERRQHLHRKQVRVLATIAMNFTDEDGRTRLTHDASVYGTSLAPLQDLLERGQRAGEFRDFNTRTMAMTVRAAVDVVGPQLSVIPDLLDAYARDLASLFRHACRYRKLGHRP